ncbi:MAG: hypothetical protein GY909_08920 [Oligoflexia bacterium]|nr:hypothetical protein [Oligoflexia bacterium]
MNSKGDLVCFIFCLFGIAFFILVLKQGDANIQTEQMYLNAFTTILIFIGKIVLIIGACVTTFYLGGYIIRKINKLFILWEESCEWIESTCKELKSLSSEVSKLKRDIRELKEDSDQHYANAKDIVSYVKKLKPKEVKKDDSKQMQKAENAFMEQTE